MPWEQLRSISEEIWQEYRDAVVRVPEACPNDGEPLLEGPDGQLYCPYDGWRPTT